ncbi:MAG: hypothetical protein OXE82_03830 [Rhodobacter sp.]|nr:hypothetical protein [Rhodobacter sp.]
MAQAAFNMIAETQRLRDAGLPQQQAEAVTLAIHAGVTGGVATKADLEALRGDFKALRGDVSRDIEALRGDFKALGARVDALDAKIDSLGARLDTELKWIKAIGGVIVAILILPWLAELFGAVLPGP